MSDTLVIKVGDMEVGRGELPMSGDILSALIPPREIIVVVDPGKMAYAMVHELHRAALKYREKP